MSAMRRAKNNLRALSYDYYIGYEVGKDDDMVHANIPMVFKSICEFALKNIPGHKKGDPIEVVFKADGTPLFNSKNLFSDGLVIMSNEEVPNEIRTIPIGHSYGHRDTHKHYHEFLADAIAAMKTIQ
jgi:hypothetical protein